MRIMLKKNIAKIWKGYTKTAEFFGNDTTAKCRILTYHSVHPNHPRAVKPDDFERQMKYLADNDFKVIPLQKLLTMADSCDAEKTIILTFDDGYADNFNCAYPILRYFDLPATIFLTTRYIRSGKDQFPTSEGKLYKNLEMLTWRQVEIMSERKIDFGSHTHLHTDATTIDRSEFENQLLESRTLIKNHIQKNVELFCFPFGKEREDAADVLQKTGFKAACGTMWGTFLPGRVNLFSIPRCEIVHEDSFEDFVDKVNGCWDYIRYVHLFRKRFGRVAAVYT